MKKKENWWNNGLSWICLIYLLSINLARGSHTSRGRQHTGTQSRWWFHDFSCDRSSHLTNPIALCFSFSQVLVRPRCPLTNDFWFAHFTSGPHNIRLTIGLFSQKWLCGFGTDTSQWGAKARINDQDEQSSIRLSPRQYSNIYDLFDFMYSYRL